MESIISKQEIKDLMGLDGEVRGANFKEMTEFILKEEGEEGLQRLEKLMADIGCPIKCKEIKTMDFYPLGLWGVFLIAIKRLFNYDNEKFQEIGRTNVKFSLLLKLLMKYFFSIEKLIKEIPKTWRKYYTVGNLKTVEYNKEKNYVILRLENFSLVPVLCQDLIGYLSGIAQMVVGKKTNCKETKCVHRGDNYHEFLIEW